MIKRVQDHKVWFFYDEHEPIAITIYNPCTDHSKYMIIIEEPSEGGPDIEIHYRDKERVAAAFGLSIEETELRDRYVEEWEGYAVSIPQILFDAKEGKYFCGSLYQNPDGNGWSAEKSHAARYVSRRDAVEHFLSGKSICDRLQILNTTELSII